jgi:SAM-dependent methyltransferase
MASWRGNLTRFLARRSRATAPDPDATIEQAVIRDISPFEGMYGRYAGAAEHYAAVGRSALAAVRLAMLAAGKTDVENLLDLPCGHGRVLRYLKAAFPAARLTACDLDREGVDFCARTFGAVPVYSHGEPDRLRFPDRFDLVWCGSLLTHLPAERWRGFLQLFRSLLRPHGLLVFTTHGRLPAAWMGQGLVHYGLGGEAARRLVADYDQSGFAYADYPDANGYGMSLAAPRWVVSEVERLGTLRLVLHSEAAWDDHQDVVACVGIEAPPRAADHLAAGRHRNVLRILRELES